MKSFVKNNIFGFILGVIVTGALGVSAAAMFASSISYDNTNSGLKKSNGQDVTTVQEAIDELYLHSDLAYKPVLLWTNPDPTVDFSAQTLQLDLSEYKYVVVVVISDTANDYLPRASTIVPVLDYEHNAIGMGSGNNRWIRYANANSTGITFGTGYYAEQFGRADHVIPYKIYGIKGELGLDLGISE